MDFKSVKEFMYSELKPMGFMPISSKRILIKDGGFYLTVVEIQPVRKEAFLLNEGVKFLWTSDDGILYDYADGCGRIIAKGSPFGAVFYDDPSANMRIEQMIKELKEQIVKYQELKNLDTFHFKIENRDDFTKHANPNFEQRDVSLAIAKMFLGQVPQAKKILHTASDRSMIARKLLEHCDNIESFHNELVGIINNCREQMSLRFKTTLDPISAVWTF